MPTGRIPAPGYTWNPLTKIKPNTRPCICGEDKKFKKCCGPKQPSVLPIAMVEALVKKKGA